MIDWLKSLGKPNLPVFDHGDLTYDDPDLRSAGCTNSCVRCSRLIGRHQ